MGFKVNFRFNVLDTDPPICLNPVRRYRLKDGTVNTYWKAEIHVDGRKRYVCYVRRRDAAALVKGVLDPVEYFRDRGLEVKRRVNRMVKREAKGRRGYTCWVRYVYAKSDTGSTVTAASVADGDDMKVVLKLLLVEWSSGAVYVYFKRHMTLWGNMRIPFTSKERPIYIGRCDEAVRSIWALAPLLKSKGFILLGPAYDLPRMRRGRPPKQPEAEGESVEDYGREAWLAKHELWGEEARMDEAELWGEESELADRELWGEEPEE
ncbi:MAG: hypothetical protein QXR17_00105 [Candidatus Bathyarchaeia archaeon]